MDNLGDWLYIVLLVIAGVSSFLGSGKKKKRPAMPPVASDADFTEEESTHSSGGLWDLFEEQPPQPPQQPTVPPVVSRKKKKKKTHPSPAVTSPFLTGEGKYSDRIAAHPSVRLESVEEEPGLMPDNVFSDMTELRRAIICAEILNRKYV